MADRATERHRWQSIHQAGRGRRSRGAAATGEGHAGTACAADSMSRATSSGWDTMATWLEGTSIVVAPMRLANSRSASGGIASSSLATRYQVGWDFQAGTPITSVKAEPARACCTAYM